MEVTTSIFKQDKDNKLRNSSSMKGNNGKDKAGRKYCLTVCLGYFDCLHLSSIAALIMLKS